MSSTQIFIKYYLRAEDVRTEMKYKPSFLISGWTIIMIINDNIFMFTVKQIK